MPARLCPKGHLVQRAGPCPPCERERLAARGTREDRGYDNAWRKLRLTILERDGYTCRLRRPGCRGEASTVDHIVPKARGGSDDPLNLAAACISCNSGKRDRVG